MQRGGDEALARAKEAVANGDAWGAVEAFRYSLALDGLTRRIRAKWPRLDHEQVNLALSMAQEHIPGLAEVTVLIRRAGRVVPVAMRLDGAKGRWELVELQY